MYKIKILGAGLAGLLAYQFFKNEDTVILEKEKKENIFRHNAILRTKKEEFPRMLGINYEKVELEKNYLFKDSLHITPNIEMKNNYSIKISDKLLKRSINDENNNKNRYIFDIFDINFDKYNVLFNEKIETLADIGDYDFCISTLPMPIMSKISKMEIKQSFETKPIFVYFIYLNIDSELHQTIYECNEYSPIYRMTLNKKIITIEATKEVEEGVLINKMKYFGLLFTDIESIEKVEQSNGKIYRIDDNTRKAFILNLTNEYNIYSLGRYAIWKPKLMLDDLLDDLYKIKKMMNISKEVRLYENNTN
jgi:hypothetical protein